MKTTERLAQARLLLKLAEHIRKMELYYEGNIKEIAKCSQSPLEYPLFNIQEMKIFSEKRLIGIEALKSRYEAALKLNTKGAITEDKLVEYGFQAIKGFLNEHIYVKKVNESQSINISKSVMLGITSWSISLHVYRDSDFISREDGFYHLRNITKIEELESIIDLTNI